jgi:cell division septation protein DedD
MISAASHSGRHGGRPILRHRVATGPTAAPFVEPGDRAPIGLRIEGRYRIIAELGAGASGTVCAAEDEATGHRVAIRLLPQGLTRTPQVAQTIVRLGQSIVEASTSHPGLVRVLAFGQAEHGRPFVAMENVEGRRLSEILSEGKPLRVDSALRLALELGEAVETLHNLGFVHGALRPRNVVMLRDGRVKLMDVELAGLRDMHAVEDVIAAKPPAEYLAPEQIRRAPVTEKADIYAFAILLYQMLCGMVPFQAAAREAVLARHLTATPASLRRRRRAIPVSVERVVAQALEKQPERRPFMHDVLNRLWTEAHRPAARWKRAAVIELGAALAVSISLLTAWGPLAPRPSAVRPPARPAPRAAAEQVPTNAPPTASTLAAETGPAAKSVLAAAAVTSSTAASAAARSDAYWVQVGAFKDRGAATRLAARLREQNYRVEELSTGTAPGPAASASGEALQRVRVGPYKDRAAATAGLKEIAAKGYEPFIVHGPPRATNTVP